MLFSPIHVLGLQTLLHSLLLGHDDTVVLVNEPFHSLRFGNPVRFAHFACLPENKNDAEMGAIAEMYKAE